MAATLHTLSNGVRVVIDADDRVDLSSVGMYFTVGSRFENPKENGIAHFLEHMAFKGTPKRNVRALMDEFASLGADPNAFTGQESTCYYVSGLGKDAVTFIDIMSDLVMNPLLPANELEIERGAILQEINQYQDDADSVLMEKAQALAYPRQPYGATVLGPAANIQTLTRGQLDKFRRKHYHAGNLIVSVSGNVKPAEVLKKLEATVGKLPVRPRSAFQKAAYNGGFLHEQSQTAQFRMSLQFPAFKETDPRNTAGQMFSHIFGGGMSSRLFRSIREERGLVYGISSYLNMAADTGTFGIYAATDDKGIKQLMPVLFDEINKIRKDGVTPQELDAVKRHVAVGLVRKQESIGRRMLANAVNLHEHGKLLDPKAQMAAVEAVTAQQIKDVANDLFKGPMTLATRGPGAAVEPFHVTSGRIKKLPKP